MIKRYILPFLLFGLLSCSDDFLNQLDPNAVSVENYFQTENDALLAVNGLYQVLRSGSTIGEGSALYSEERSDNSGRDDNQSNSGEPFQFNDFSILPSNSYLRSHWSSMYDGIARTNTVITGIEAMTFTSDELKERYLAESKFVRGLLYFHLVRKFGDIPLSIEEVTSKDQADALASRAEESLVYAQIVKDFEDALNSDLPDTQSEYAVGRASKAAVHALLGQVYLTMGATLKSNKEESLMKAEKNLTASYELRSFGKLKEIPYSSVFSVAEKMNNKELIFQIQYLQGDQNYHSSIARNNQARGENINSKFPSTGSGTRASKDLVYEYEPGDLRKEFSVKFASDSRVNDWFVTKFRDDSEAAGTAGWGGNDWIVIRYADVMLMLAETKMHLGKDVEAISLLNEVRERAGLPIYEVAKQNENYQMKYPTLKDAILHERRVELAFENHRWFDLIRFFDAQELVEYFQKKDPENYGNAKLSNISIKDRYFPIPFDEYKLDPIKMYQNPGY